MYFFIQGHPPGTEQAGGPLITKKNQSIKLIEQIPASKQNRLTIVVLKEEKNKHQETKKYVFILPLISSPLLTTDINVACSAPIAVIVGHGAPRRNLDRGTHIWFTEDRVFHICQKKIIDFT